MVPACPARGSGSGTSRCQNGHTALPTGVVCAPWVLQEVHGQEEGQENGEAKEANQEEHGQGEAASAAEAAAAGPEVIW